MKKTGFARRAFAWMLCLAMVLSMLPGAVFAQEIPEETVEIATEETLPVEETTEGSTEEPEQETMTPETTDGEEGPLSLQNEEEEPTSTETQPEEPERPAMPEITRQPGTFTSDTDDSPYPGEYTTSQTPADLWFQFQTPDKDVSFHYQVYCLLFGEDAQEESGLTVSEQQVQETEDGQLVTCAVHWEEGHTYPEGEHGFYVEIIASREGAQPVSVATDVVTLTFSEEETALWEGTGAQDAP